MTLREDACIIGLALAEMCRSFARKLLVKIEIFDKNVCSRWHCDFFVGRAIVSCSGGARSSDASDAATEYLADHSVHWAHLEDRCECRGEIVRDGDMSLVETVRVGDLLFMKGRNYKHVCGETGDLVLDNNALVHKSPKPVYDGVTGMVAKRLVLKVDVEG